MIDIQKKIFQIKHAPLLINKATAYFAPHYPNYTDWICNMAQGRYEALYYTVDDKAVAYLLFFEEQKEVRLYSVFVVEPPIVGDEGFPCRLLSSLPWYKRYTISQSLRPR